VKSKCYIFVGLLVIATLVGAFVWRLRMSSPPSLGFVEFRTSAYGRLVAVFRATNKSEQPYSYLGGAERPFYSYGVPTATGWRIEEPGFCGTGCGFHELAAHTSINFEVPSSSTSAQFALGVHFVRATPKEIYSRLHSLIYGYRHFVQRWLPEPEPT
jgi:hypothetical protein